MNISHLTAPELVALISASKGGNLLGVTEDHRYAMMERLKAMRATSSGTVDFITTSFVAAGLSYLLGYVWFLISDINTPNAILMLAGLTWLAIAIVTALVASLVWVVRHVRITIV